MANWDRRDFGEQEEEPRSIAWRKYDWSAPLAFTIYTLYAFVMDGFLFVCVIGFAHGVELLLDLIESGNVPMIGTYPVHASTIVRFGDYCLFAGFVIIQTLKIVRKVWQNDD
jgi:hypothetical protein